MYLLANPFLTLASILLFSSSSFYSNPLLPTFKEAFSYLWCPASSKGGSATILFLFPSVCRAAATSPLPLNQAKFVFSVSLRLLETSHPDGTHMSFCGTMKAFCQSATPQHTKSFWTANSMLWLMFFHLSHGKLKKNNSILAV